MNKFFKNAVHNLVVHPLMTVLPSRIANRLHDSNAEWAFGSIPDPICGTIDMLKGLGYRMIYTSPKYLLFQRRTDLVGEELVSDVYVLRPDSNVHFNIVQDEILLAFNFGSLSKGLKVKQSSGDIDFGSTLYVTGTDVVHSSVNSITPQFEVINESQRDVKLFSTSYKKPKLKVLK